MSMVFAISYLAPIKEWTIFSGRGVLANGPECKLSKIFSALWRTSVMGSDAHVLRSKTQRQRSIERLQGLHLAIEPCFCIFTIPIRPAHAGAQVLHAQTLQPIDSEVEPRIFIVEPLADAHAAGKRFRSQLGRAVFTQESHIVMAIVRAAFSFFVARSGRPGGRQIKQAVPMHAVHNRQQQLSRALQAKDLDFFRAKRRNACFRDPDRPFGDGANFIDLFFLGQS